MNQPCAHLLSTSRGAWRTLPGVGMVRLCKACVQEFDARLNEQQRPATPVEQYARKQEVVMSKGCTYHPPQQESKICAKVCDPGQTMCPRHLMLVPIEREAARQKELAQEELRRAAVLAKHTQKGRAA